MKIVADCVGFELKLAAVRLITVALELVENLDIECSLIEVDEELEAELEVLEVRLDDHVCCGCFFLDLSESDDLDAFNKSFSSSI